MFFRLEMNSLTYRDLFGLSDYFCTIKPMTNLVKNFYFFFFCSPEFS